MHLGTCGNGIATGMNSGLPLPGERHEQVNTPCPQMSQ